MDSRQLFRIWIARYENWRPVCWTDVPPSAVAVELAEERCLSANEAAQFLQGFNQAMLADRRSIWAVAVPVRLRYEGDLRAGQPLPISATNAGTG